MKYVPMIVLVIEVVGVVTTVGGTVAWLVGKNWVAASLCGAGVLLLSVAVLIARSKFRGYFVATLATLVFGVLLVGAAMGATIPGIVDDEAAGPGTTNSPTAPSSIPSTINSPPAPRPPSPAPSPSPSSQECKTPPYPFNPSSVRGTITPPSSDGNVPQWFGIAGTLQNVPANRTPFLVTELVGERGNEVWDTQKCFINVVWPAPIRVEANGTWNTRIALGGGDPKFKNTLHKVTLVMVDEKTEYQFRVYIRQAEQTKKYTGVETKFAGAIEAVDDITLKRL